MRKEGGKHMKKKIIKIGICLGILLFFSSIPSVLAVNPSQQPDTTTYNIDAGTITGQYFDGEYGGTESVLVTPTVTNLGVPLLSSQARYLQLNIHYEYNVYELYHNYETNLKITLWFMGSGGLETTIPITQPNTVYSGDISHTFSLAFGRYIIGVTGELWVNGEIIASNHNEGWVRVYPNRFDVNSLEINQVSIDEGLINT